MWPGAVLRGDYGTITVGGGSSIQDGTVIHAGPGFPDDDRRPVRRRAPHPPRGLHARGRVVWRAPAASCCTGPSSATGATVGANAVVPNNMVVPPGALALGVPAKILEGRSDVPMIRLSAAEYVGNAKRYRASLRRLD